MAEALARRGTIQQQITAQEALDAAADTNYQLSLARYREGVDPYLATVIHIAAQKPTIAPGTGTKQIGAMVARQMDRAVEDVIVAARARLQDAALAAAAE